MQAVSLRHPERDRSPYSYPVPVMSKNVLLFASCLLVSTVCAQITAPVEPIPLRPFDGTPIRVALRPPSATAHKAALNWTAIGQVTDQQVTAAAVAGDGNDLLLFACQPRPSINIDEGHIYKWSGSSWNVVAAATNECHHPDLAVQDGVVAGVWQDDGYDLGYTTNINGPYVTLGSPYLTDQWGMGVAFAQGLPYRVYASRWSDGSLSSFMMLHVDSPVGVGERVQLRGGWRVVNTSVGTDPALAGDETGWYAAFRQGPNLYVNRAARIDGRSVYENQGDGFTVAGSPAHPEIVRFRGRPVVAWLEEGNSKLYIADWDGETWTLFGAAELDGGTYASLRMVADAANLYVVAIQNEGGAHIAVSRWDGTAWSGFAGAVASGPTSSILTVDVAIYQGQPVVAFVENREVKVVTQALPTAADDVEQPTAFRLHQNYPNPFNPVTTIAVDLPQPGPVALDVFDVLGQPVATLAEGSYPAGTHRFSWNAAEHANGVYLYRLRAGAYTETRRMVLLK